MRMTDTTTTTADAMDRVAPPVFDFNLRRVSAGTLAKLATEAAPGSAQRMALLAELERRRMPVVLLPWRESYRPR